MVFNVAFSKNYILLLILPIYFLCRSIGKKLSSLLYTNGEDDWSEILEKTPPSAVAPSNQVSETISENPAEKKRQISMPILPSYNEPVKPVTTKEEAEETTQLVRQ